MALAGQALASARLPARRGAVTDDADVLSAQTVSDFSSYAQQVEAETGLRLHVALVHFWDGLEAQAYTDALFEAWSLGDEDILLCGAAGEDTFASTMGESAAATLGRQSAENLMYTSSRFGTLFASQQYDAALAEYCRAFNTLLIKQTGADVSLDGLFGTAQATPAPVSESRLWDEVMDAINDSSADYQTAMKAPAHRKRPERGRMDRAGGAGAARVPPERGEDARAERAAAAAGAPLGVAVQPAGPERADRHVPKAFLNKRGEDASCLPVTKEGFAMGCPSPWVICPSPSPLAFRPRRWGSVPLQAVMISFFNVTSAGQLAGLQLMATGAGLAEMALTQLTINLRYALMSLSLSQKLDSGQ